MEAVAHSPSFEMVVARSTGEIDSLRTAWTALQEQQESATFNTDPDRFLSLVETQRGARPHVMLLEQHARPVAMVVGSVAKIQIRCRIGYQRIWLPSLKCLTILNGGLLGSITAETADRFLDEIGRRLRLSEIDAVFFNRLDTRSPVYSRAAAKIHGLCCSHFNRVEVHRTMTVPASLEDFYQSCSKKHRANLRRYVRKIEEQYAERATVLRYWQEESVDSFIEAASQVSAKTYQHQLGCGMQGDEQTRSLMKRVAQRGWLRGHILFLDGQPCAFQHGVIYRGRYFLEQIGFDPKWKDLNVGTVLFLEALQDLVRDGDKPAVIDFGFGDADYKRSYGDNSWTDASFYLFAPRTVPVLVNLMYSGTTGLSAGLAHILERMGSIGWIKRRWRNRLEKQEAESKD
jgi:CelD/BcsL family acetyltransferase involved in cellulose biosynthesis